MSNQWDSMAYVTAVNHPACMEPILEAEPDFVALVTAFQYTE